jgi:two-component system sensor histidine kinase ChiS
VQEDFVMQYTAMGETTTLVNEQSDIPSFVTNSSYVLVVDDDQAILSVVMLLLETEGYSGVGVSDSQKVIPFLERMGVEHKPKLILLDLMMPGISGYDIAHWLSQHEQYATIPIVIMTADHRVQDARAVPGASDCLRKPFHLDQMLKKIGRYIALPLII